MPVMSGMAVCKHACYGGVFASMPVGGIVRLQAYEGAQGEMLVGVDCECAGEGEEGAAVVTGGESEDEKADVAVQGYV